jgi:hypothetical protein
MKKSAFIMKKWTVRAFVALGILLGLTSCNKTFVGPIENVYGPPPSYGVKAVPVEDVYGPPIEKLDTIKTPENAVIEEPVKTKEVNDEEDSIYS